MWAWMLQRAAASFPLQFGILGWNIFPKKLWFCLLKWAQAFEFMDISLELGHFIWNAIGMTGIELINWWIELLLSALTRQDGNLRPTLPSAWFIHRRASEICKLSRIGHGPFFVIKISCDGDDKRRLSKERQNPESLWTRAIRRGWILLRHLWFGWLFIIFLLSRS
jgi:hypothetical protein